MALSNLKDVYVDQLQDVYSANRQALGATQALAAAAHHPELKEALDRGVTGIREGMTAIEGLVKENNADPRGEFCKGMEGIVAEVKAHVLDANFDDADAKDAMIITQYQRMAHYGIAGYGCCTAFARRLGLDGQADKLQDCLDATYHGDKEMTAIALGEINRAAA
ncbi:MAG: hypothetical protein CMK07_12225 [Ponticaulis sp.]|nr:hypothetical protein [Ponticaulis sp.]